MKAFNNMKGRIGEDLATQFLKGNKYKILERNYKNKIGEIDIIALDKKIIVFVEVKTRSSLEYGFPSEAVDTKKQNKIRLVANAYLQTKKIDDKDLRFDVIEILDGEINHIKNAF